MSRTRTTGCASGAAALLALALAPAAGADVTAPRLLSTSAVEQAASAGAPAISADGRWIAFEATLGSVRGVFRRDLASGAVELVAGGDAYAEGPALPNDAASPSISADGRRIAFSTTAPLDPAHDAGTSRDVYVRDMTRPGAPCADGSSECGFELASALDGSRRALTYADTDGTAPIPARAGSVTSPRAALSADGRRVAFEVRAASDLTSGPDGSTPGVATPAGQVAVRDLDTLRTTLVSVERDELTGAMSRRPVAGGAVHGRDAGPARSVVALSADGTTVAWLGASIHAQAPVLRDEPDASFPSSYNEPLWRRIADGPQAPTRRVVGGGDPLAPGCPPDGTLAVPACRGPFPNLRDDARSDKVPNAAGWLLKSALLDGTPQLSADGRTVALVGDPTVASNAFLVDMRDGLTRIQALRPLTREVPLANPNDSGTLPFLSATGDVWSVGLSAGGRRVALVTARTRFPLAPPRLVGGAPARIGVTEVYRADLDAAALERVSVPPTGGASDQPAPHPENGDGASLPTFSADGRTLVFASTASNLALGDANGASDVFAVQDVVVPEQPGETTRSPLPPPIALTPEWRLTARAVSLRDGRVRIEAVVPGRGTLRARAVASVAQRRVVRVRARAPRSRAAARGRRAPRWRRVVRRVPVRRRVAERSAKTVADGIVTVPLALGRRDAARARSRTGLRATVALRFTGRGGRPLRDTLEVVFRTRRTPPDRRTKDGGTRR